MDAHLKRAFFVGLTWVGLSPAHAADFVDPTLPPAPARAEETRTTNAAPPTEAPRLQMILRGPGEVRTALVDGHAVRVGDSLTVQGEAARVIRISDSALHLKRADQSIETLELAPDVAKAVQRAKPEQPVEKRR